MKKKYSSIIWGNYYGFVIMGMCGTFFGATMPYIRELYGLTYEQGGISLGMMAAGSLVLGFVSGFIGDWIGMKRVLVFGHAMYILGMLIVILSTSVLGLYSGLLVLGFGWGACNTSINMVVNDYVDGDGRTMSLLHMSFCVGAFIIPMLSGFLMRGGLPWRGIMIGLVGLELINVLIAIKMPIQGIKKKDLPNPEKGKTSINWNILIFMTILFFYVSSEGTISGWLVTYLSNGLGFTEVFAQNALSLFWIAMILGRLANSVISRRFQKHNIILISSFGALATILLFSNTTSSGLLILSVVGLGFFFSGIYPLTLADANPLIKGSGAMSAMITSGGGLGSMLAPYISGRVAEKAGPSAMMSTILVYLLFLFLLTILNKRVHNKGGLYVSLEYK